MAKYEVENCELYADGATSRLSCDVTVGKRTVQVRLGGFVKPGMKREDVEKIIVERADDELRMIDTLEKQTAEAQKTVEAIDLPSSFEISLSSPKPKAKAKAKAK